YRYLLSTARPRPFNQNRTLSTTLPPSWANLTDTRLRGATWNSRPPHLPGGAGSRGPAGADDGVSVHHPVAKAVSHGLDGAARRGPPVGARAPGLGRLWHSGGAAGQGGPARP